MTDRGVQVQTDIRDDLRALRRPAALAALGAAAGGVVAARAPVIDAWALVATVDALGTADEDAVAVLDAGQVTGLAWVAAVAGIGVVVLALLVALDRPPHLAETALLVAAAVIACVTVAVLVARPDPAAFPGSAAAGLAAGDVDLPTGVEIDLAVRPTAGVAVLGGAAVLIGVGTLVATRRG